MFDEDTRKITLNGKTFNPKNENQESDSEYSKAHFAKHVVKPNSQSIDFSGFNPLLQRIEAVIKHYKGG
jgi:hypothetical protein